MHIDWVSFMWGAVTWMSFAQIGRQISHACDRMIDYYQRKLDEREGR